MKALTEKQIKEATKKRSKIQKDFAKASEPLIKFMAENMHPHCTAIINSTSAELVEGITTHRTKKYIVD